MKKDNDDKAKVEHIHLTVSPVVKELARLKAEEMFGGNLSALFAHLIYLENAKICGTFSKIDGDGNVQVMGGGRVKAKTKIKK